MMFTRKYILFFALFAASVILYLPSLHSPFVADDHNQILDNPSIQNIYNIKNIIINDVRPTRVIMNISYALNWFISQDSTWSYHLLNLILHLVNAFLLLIFLEFLLPQRTKTHFLAVALFLIHPLQIQSVTYIMGRISLLEAFAYLGLLNLYAYKKSKSFSFIFLLFATSFIKESCITIPILFPFFDLVFYGKKEVIKNKKLYFLYLIPIVLGFVLQLSLFKIFFAKHSSTFGTHLFPVAQYLALQLYYLAFYLFLFLNPARQSLIHPLPPFTSYYAIVAVIVLLLGISVLYFAIKKRKYNPAILFLLIFFLDTWGTTNSFLQFMNPFAEYRLYTKNITLFILFILIFEYLLNRLNLKSKSSHSIITSLLFAYFLLFNYLHQVLWQDPQKLLLYSHGLYPDAPYIHTELGTSALRANNPQKAIEHFRKAIELYKSLNLKTSLKPDFYLSATYYQLGYYEQALDLIKNPSFENINFKPIDFYILYLSVLKKLNMKKEFTPLLDEALKEFPADKLPRWDKEP